MFSRLSGKRIFVGLVSLSPVACAVWWRVRQDHTNAGLQTKSLVVHAKSTSNHEDNTTRREKRFNQFASCKFGEQNLMTPADFLESIIHDDLPGKHLECQCSIHMHYIIFISYLLK